MNRAAVGVGLVAGALLLILILAAVRGRMVPGQATAQPSTPPPQAGDCVTEDPKDLGADLYSWTTVLPTVSTGPCTGDRFGEVTAVLPADTARAVIAGTTAHPCQASVDEFLGMQGTLPPDNGGFYRFDAVPVAVVGPDDQQRAVGQDWAACLVYLPLSGDAAVPLRIDHSLRGAWQHPVDSRLFTICWEQAVPFLFGTALLRTPSRCSAPRAYLPGPRRKRQPPPAGSSPSPPSDRQRRSTAETSTSNSSRYDPTPTTEPCSPALPPSPPTGTTTPPAWPPPATPPGGSPLLYEAWAMHPPP